jgi:N-acetyl-D-muramate 6-phosphate phosphatase
MYPTSGPRAVLFDLDGTLVDSAPDLIGTLLHLRAERGLPPVEVAALRPMASRGALSLLEAGFGSESGIDPASLREAFLEHYAANLWVQSRPFDGIQELLELLKSDAVALGIVTNKVESLAVPLLEQAGWSKLFDCLIAGDSTPKSKPDPQPVLEACLRLGVSPEQTLFIGDDLRDIRAGRAAGTCNIVAAWGYLPAGESGHEWGADAVIAHPAQLPACMKLIDGKRT